jgi:restriction system protein
MNQQPYKKLYTYWFSVIIYDLTLQFCNKYILSDLSNLRSPDKRMADQMLQAARSGKQNIVEGSEELKTSFKMGIKLTNVAKASVEELLADYEDFLRQRDLEVWSKEDFRVKRIRAFSADLVRGLSGIRNLSRKPRLPKDPETAANTLLTLCHQATYLLNKQVDGLEEKHKKEGGYTEKLYSNRKRYLNSLG